MDTCAVLDVAGKLPASSCDVVATGFAHSRNDATIHETLRE